MIHLKNVHLASLFVAAGNRPPLVLNLQVSKRFLGHSLIFSNLPTFGVYCMLLLKTPSSGSKVWRKIKSLMIFLHLFSFVFSSMSQKNIIRKWKLLSWHHDSRMVSNLHRWELILKLAIPNHLPGDQALRFKKCPRIAATNAMLFFFFVIYIYGVKFSLFNWHQAVGEKAMCSYIFNWQMVCLLFTPLLSSSWSSSCIVSDYRPQKSINRITYRIFQVQESNRWRAWRPPPAASPSPGSLPRLPPCCSQRWRRRCWTPARCRCPPNQSPPPPRVQESACRLGKCCACGGERFPNLWICSSPTHTF